MPDSATQKTFIDVIKASDATPLEKALMALGEEKYKTLSKLRYVEEKNWQQQGLMGQAKQWLDWDREARRWIEQRPDRKKPRPMPIINYLAKICNAQANNLGAQLPQLEAIALDDTPDAERAADMALRAKDIIDRESGMIYINPTIAKQVVYFGIAAVKDYWNEHASNGVKRPIQQMNTSMHMMLGCDECGETSDMGEIPPEAAQAEPPRGVPCPNCNSDKTNGYPEQQVESVDVTIYGTGKIESEVVSCFEFYIPRECQDPNLAPVVLQRTRYSIGKVRSLFPDIPADRIKEDQHLDISQYRLQTLRSMMGYTLGSEGRSYKDSITYAELWCKWEELPKQVQDMLEKEFSSNPAPIEDGGYGEEALARAKAFGIYVKYAPINGLMLEWGINPLVDEQTGDVFFPYTFYMWEKDVASPYPNALAFQLVPLQKILNQIDSLSLLSQMSNATGKWIAPKTQLGVFKPDGSPTEVVWYDNVGDGKTAPTFTQPNAISNQFYQWRGMVIQDMMSIGLTEAVTQGQAPGGGVGSFRGLAYLGAKANEQISTQRQLWEDAHELRYRKVLLMARLFWADERKAKIAGENGKFKAVSLTGQDLNGNYSVQLKPGSSKPKLLSEKLGFIQMAVEGKLLDPTDQDLKIELLRMFGLDNLDPKDKVHVDKALRDLDKAKRGDPSVMASWMANPYIKWDVLFRYFSEYTLSEEFEEQDPQIQASIMALAQMLNQKVTEVAANAAMGQMATAAMGAQGGSQPAQPQEAGLAEAMNAQQQQPNPLGQVPGQNTTPGQVEQAATAQGTNIASQVG